MTIKLGLSIGYSGAQMELPVTLVQRAEELDYDSVWSAEACGSDAITPLAFPAAKNQPHQARYRHHATGRAHASQGRHVGRQH